VKQTVPYLIAAIGVIGGLLTAGPAIERVTSSKKAKAVITAPTYFAGGPVVLSGEKSTGHSWEWKVNAPFVPVDVDGCCVAVNVCTPGVYTAQLTVKAGGSKYTESTAVHMFQVGGSPPPGPVPPQPTPPGPQPVPPGPIPPPPGPGPTPPVPPGPDNKFGLAKIAHDLASAVNVPNRATEAKALAAALKAVAKKIDDGVLKGVLDARQEIIAAANALGADRPAWDDALQGINRATASVIGKLPKLPDLGQALKEISYGLESVQ
jgi:hypothetical protein